MVVVMVLCGDIDVVMGCVVNIDSLKINLQ